MARTPPDAPPATDETPFGRLRAWLDTHADTLLDDPGNNLVGVGIGALDGGPLSGTSELAITGFVEKKLSKREIRTRNVTDFAAAATAMAAGTGFAPALNVVEIGAAFTPHAGLSVDMGQRGLHGGLAPSLDLQKRFDILRSGVGIANPRGYPKQLSVGTLGFFLRDGAGRTYLVSNNHVIAEENAAAVGDPVVQPGTLDLTSTELSLMPTRAKLHAALRIADLAAWVDIRFHGPQGIPFNEVDCALAELATSQNTAEIARVGFGGRITGTAAPPAIDPATGALKGPTRVWKAGRTTGWTEGDITEIAVVTDVTYGSGKARFRNQIGIRASPDNNGPFSRQGDSGSGILDADHALVGLLFAGTEFRTLANPIDLVLKELQAKLARGALQVVT